eukprot:2804906-Rhodomonas_salina.3
MSLDHSTSGSQAPQYMHAFPPHLPYTQAAYGMHGTPPMMHPQYAGGGTPQMMPQQQGGPGVMPPVNGYGAAAYPMQAPVTSAAYQPMTSRDRLEGQNAHTSASAQSNKPHNCLACGKDLSSEM